MSDENHGKPNPNYSFTSTQLRWTIFGADYLIRNLVKKVRARYRKYWAMLGHLLNHELSAVYFILFMNVRIKSRPNYITLCHHWSNCLGTCFGKSTSHSKHLYKRTDNHLKFSKNIFPITAVQRKFRNLVIVIHSNHPRNVIYDVTPRTLYGIGWSNKVYFWQPY